MSEFVNRMDAQRKLLQVVNRREWPKEELFGLSRKAIDRWVSRNGISAESQLVSLIESASAKLFFLANRSQEQISEDYRTISCEIAAIARQIESEIAA
jgi:hypothetical protein